MYGSHEDFLATEKLDFKGRGAEDDDDEEEEEEERLEEEEEDEGEKVDVLLGGAVVEEAAVDFLASCSILSLSSCFQSSSLSACFLLSLRSVM